jgi:hypothetical protein
MVVVMPNASNAASLPADNSSSSRPEWIRVPKVGTVCPHSGLSRSFVHSLIKEGDVVSWSMRKRGTKHGVRLVSYDSLMAYIRKAGEPGRLK